MPGEEASILFISPGFVISVFFPPLTTLCHLRGDEFETFSLHRHLQEFMEYLCQDWRAKEEWTVLPVHDAAPVQIRAVYGSQSETVNLMVAVSSCSDEIQR